MQKSEIEDVIFGNVLRDFRLASGKSQEEFGLDCGLTRNYISLLELGQRRPTLKTLISLAVGLQIPVSEIMLVFEQEYFERQGKPLHFGAEFRNPI